MYTDFICQNPMFHQSPSISIILPFQLGNVYTVFVDLCKKYRFFLQKQAVCTNCTMTKMKKSKQLFFMKTLSFRQKKACSFGRYLQKDISCVKKD